MKPSLPHHRWLVVDDNPEVLEIAVLYLRTVPDVEVIAFSRPEDVVKACLTDPTSFELLVTDFDMPGMDGIELACQLAASAPRLRVLLMTGSHLNEFQLLRPEVHLVLPKPLTREMLLAGAASLVGSQDFPKRSVDEPWSVARSE